MEYMRLHSALPLQLLQDDERKINAVCQEIAILEFKEKSY